MFSFIKWFGNSFVVIFSNSSVLQKFDVGFTREISWSTLSSIVHDGYLKIASVLVSHNDCWVNWIVVRRDIGGLFTVRVWFSMVEISLKHNKSIGISPEFTFWIKTVIELPINSNIFSSIVGTDRNLVNHNFKFYELIKISRRKSDLCDSLLLSSFVIENDSILVQQNTLLIYDICIQLREFIGILDESIFPLRF